MEVRLLTTRVTERLLGAVLVRQGRAICVGNLGIWDKSRAWLWITLGPVAGLWVALLPVAGLWVALLPVASLWVARLPLDGLWVSKLPSSGRKSSDRCLVVIGRGHAKGRLGGPVDVVMEWVGLPHAGVATLILGHDAVVC